MEYGQRFARLDLTDKVFGKMGVLQDLAGNGELERSFAFVDQATRCSEPPPEEAAPHCKKCLLFRECVGRGLDHPIWELPVRAHRAPACRVFVQKQMPWLSVLAAKTVQHSNALFVLVRTSDELVASACGVCLYGKRA